MGKTWIEVSLISARGLRRTSSLWKLQWFAAGWIDPDNRYCTKVDASGNSNPVWKTKFAALVEDSNFESMTLHVEVYSGEPFFLRERLQGTATVVLKEFLAKYSKNTEASRPGKEEVGSYQLRKKNSNRPQGFVDISIRISEDRGEPSPYAGNEGEFVLMNHGNNIASSSKGDPLQAYPSELRLAPPRRPENQPSNLEYAHPMSFATNYSISSMGGPSHPPAATGPSYHPPHTPPPAAAGPSYHPPAAAGPSYHPPHTPPPPPPPSNVGYLPTFLPNSDYINMPSSVAAPGPGARPGLVGVGVGAGAGAGALAAGAVIFGDDFMSGFSIPASLSDPTLTVSTGPPF